MGSKKKLVVLLLITLFLTTPIVSLIFSVSGINLDNFNYLWDYLLIDYSLNTIKLVLMTIFFSLIFGVLPAWFISTTDFKLRKVYDLLLYLPLAIPTYIMAFTYSDIVSFTGPVQTFFRNYSPKFAEIINIDYLQIEFLSILLSLSLYPYVYTTCRIAFARIGTSYINLSKTLGLSELSTFFKIVIPISRAAIFSGLFLIVMEVLNEYGAVNYFGVNTYTSGIFRAWGPMVDIKTASILALFLFIIVALFFILERYFNSKYKFNYAINSGVRTYFPNSTIKYIILNFVCLVPIVFGFVVPLFHMLKNIFNKSLNHDFYDVLNLTGNTVFIALIASFFIILFSVIIQFINRLSKSRLNKVLGDVVSLSYAMPGAVVGIAFIILFTVFADFFGILMVGSFLVLIYAYVVRYMAVGISPIKSSFEKQPESIDQTAQSLGLKTMKILSKIYIPINRPAIIIAFLLCFIDIMKDLPLTLILRPFNFDTLATQTYEFAVEEMLARSSVYSFAIVFLGTVMLIILKNTLNKDIDVS